MPRVILPPALRQRAAGNGLVEVDGDTPGRVLHGLESAYPELRGWVLDERGLVRTHVRLFINGVAASLESPVGPQDELHVITAISGG